MKRFLPFFVIGTLWFGCNSTVEDRAAGTDQVSFNSQKWKTKNDSGYPYREEMVNSVLYSDSIRTLRKPEVLALLGEPDRTNENHYYYLIDQSNLGLWTLHSSSIVIKFNEQDSVEWIRLHE